MNELSRNVEANDMELAPTTFHVKHCVTDAIICAALSCIKYASNRRRTAITNREAR